MKILFLSIASVVVLVLAVLFMFTAKDILLISATLLLVIFAFYALWRPPKKHKDYSLSDQQEATTQSGATDLLDIKPGAAKPKQKKH
jgi:DMSO/TMAO reductase YedYZ heme-binding membrane subunit